MGSFSPLPLCMALCCGKRLRAGCCTGYIILHRFFQEKTNRMKQSSSNLRSLDHNALAIMAMVRWSCRQRVDLEWRRGIKSGQRCVCKWSREDRQDVSPLSRRVSTQAGTCWHTRQGIRFVLQKPCRGTYCATEIFKYPSFCTEIENSIQICIMFIKRCGRKTDAISHISSETMARVIAGTTMVV